MLNYLGRYYPAESFWHRADPRSKLTILLMLFTALITGSGNFPGTVLGLTLILYRTARLPWRIVGTILRQFKWLLFFTFIANWWYFGTRFGWWPALATTLSLCLKLALALLGAAWLSLVTQPLQLIDGWAKLLKPLARLGLPVSDWALFLGLTLRFVADLGQETEQIVIAQRLRGIRPGRAWRQGNLWVRSTLVPVFLATLRRAGAVAVALEARGYRQGQPRSAWQKLQFKTVDWVITLSSLAATLYFLTWIW